MGVGLAYTYQAFVEVFKLVREVSELSWGAVTVDETGAESWQEPCGGGGGREGRREGERRREGEEFQFARAS